jgi:DNA-binding MarR family transcriptional regulator
MAQYLSRGSSVNELLRQCYSLNRSLVSLASQLTEGTGISGAQWGVLSALNQDGQLRTVAETARRMGMARQSVQRVADLLADNDWVRFVSNPEDKRARLVEVTAKGRALLRRLEKRQLDWITAMTSDHSDAEFAAAARLLRDLRLKIISSLDAPARVA